MARNRFIGKCSTLDCNAILFTVLGEVGKVAQSSDYNFTEHANLSSDGSYISYCGKCMKSFKPIKWEVANGTTN